MKLKTRTKYELFKRKNNYWFFQEESSSREQLEFLVKNEIGTFKIEEIYETTYAE